MRGTAEIETSKQEKNGKKQIQKRIHYPYGVNTFDLNQIRNNDLRSNRIRKQNRENKPQKYG